MPTLDWLNRAAAFTTAAKVPYRLLEQVSAHTSHAESTTNSIAPQAINTPAIGQNGTQNDLKTDNLLIQGDNLEALKALLPFYRGQVKCIFIDPPYNTKSAFEHYDDNLEHAQWLSLMLPRLQLLRELLREDGSIWVTIDDNEGHYLKVLMDEVFGRGNFVSTVIWQKKYAPKSDSKYLSESHDFILGYARKLSALTVNRLKKGDKQNDRYTNKDNDARGPWKPDNVLRTEARDYAIFPVTLPSGREVLPPNGTSWRYTKEKFASLIADNRIWFGLDGNGRPAYKRFLSEVTDSMPATTIWTFDEVGHNDESKKEMRSLFSDNLFGTPKPERLIQRILHIATNEGDLVLDSFLGSGTTAAVAHKMGRRWIGIEMGEHAATHCLPRLQKVLDAEQGGISKAVNWQGGGAFRFLRLGDTVFDDRGRINPAVRFATLAAFVWQQDTGTALNLAASKPGTPHIGTSYIFNSTIGNEYTGYMPILPLNETKNTTQTVRPEPVEGFSEASTSSARTGLDVARTVVGTNSCTGTAYYLLYNGILGDKRPASGNVLTREVLAALLELHAKVLADAPVGVELDLVVYGEACRLGEERLKQAKVAFRHIPYDVRAR